MLHSIHNPILHRKAMSKFASVSFLLPSTVLKIVSIFTEIDTNRK